MRLSYCLFFIKTVGEKAPKMAGQGVEGLVKYLPAVESGVNVFEAVCKQDDSSVDKKMQMETLSVDTKVQETLLGAMDKPGLILAVTEAKKRDIQDIKKDGSSHRFATVEKLWLSERLKDVKIAFFEGNPTPLLNRIAATQFLCI